MSAKYRLTVTSDSTQQSHGVFATAKLPVTITKIF